MTMTTTISSVVIEVIGDILFFFNEEISHTKKKSIKSKQTTILLYA